MTTAELIAKIKAEINYRIEIYIGHAQSCIGTTRVDGLEEVLDFLSTLESEKPVPKDLAEEVKRYYSDNFDYISSDQPTLSILTNIARHFAQWGAEHLKEIEL